jgi:glutamate-1-semialdehyde 2,1-aminomutase
MSPQLSYSRKTSSSLFEEAKALLPGGVNSPVRAFKSIDGEPVFIKRAKGAYLWDEDDNQYIDFVASWGPMILGHADEEIATALEAAIKNGTSFGAPTRIENEMAKEVIKLIPSIEKVRMVNSGTEAVMGAIRLARAYTTIKFHSTKNKIVKFTGCYHGHMDDLLVQAGSGVATLGLPDSPGVTPETTQNTLVVPFNNKAALEEVFKIHGKNISAIITEPIIGNSGFIEPEAGFLEFLREITNRYNALLIFDEVMTGFRVALGGAQERFSIMPDITTLGKVIGGGLPVGAYGGKKEIMSLVAPEGPMYQAGTLSGNPLAMSAGLACLKKIQAPNFYKELAKKAQYLLEGFKENSSQLPNGLSLQTGYAGGMFGFFFTRGTINSYETAKANLDLDYFKKFYIKMLEQGVYLAPSAFEAGFVSSSHSYDDLDKVIECYRKSIL